MIRSLRTFFQAAKRHQSLNTAHVRPGKSALEMSLYRFLAARLLASGRADDLFCHTYMVLTWNLLCRSHNTAAIHLSHLKWFEDALQVYFPRMKNDQAGERSAYPRHLYANPRLVSYPCWESFPLLPRRKRGLAGCIPKDLEATDTCRI